jgi:hypothetical protein
MLIFWPLFIIVQCQLWEMGNPNSMNPSFPAEQHKKMLGARQSQKSCGKSHFHPQIRPNQA